MKTTELFLTKTKISQRKAWNTKAVVYHLYYPELVFEAINTVQEFDNTYDIIFTLAETMPEELCKLIENSTGGYVFIAANTGRDIRPFFELIRSGFLDRYELVCKLHGKKSLHRIDGDQWRKSAIKSLCANKNVISKIEHYITENNLDFVAPKSYAFLNSEIKHWKGQDFWLKKIFARSGHSLKYENLEHLPIASGSFFWASRGGLSRLRAVPIYRTDWIENAESGYKRDGNLEHLGERLCSIGRPFHARDTKISFISNDGNLFIDYEGRNRYETEQQLHEEDANKFIHQNIKTIAIARKKNTDIIGFYQITPLGFGQIRKIEGVVVNFQNLQESLVLSIKYNDKEVLRLHAGLHSNLIPQKAPGYIQDFSRDYGFCFYLPIYIKTENLKIQCKDFSYTVLSFNNKSKVKEFIAESLVIAANSFSAFYTPESIRSSNYFPTKSLREHKALRSFREEIHSEPREEKNDAIHAFVVNNPIAEIIVCRIVQKLNLSTEQVIIILHRQKQVTLLKNYKIISTNIPDIELINRKEDIELVQKFVNEFLSFIQNKKFILYAHHYFALFTYLLAWEDLCISANIHEEGNLSSVPEWDAEARQMIQFQQNYKITTPKILWGKETTLYEYFRPILIDQASICKTIETFSIHSSKLSTNFYCQSIQKTFTSGAESKLYALLALQRFYFWHPKMAFNYKYFHIAKAFEKFPKLTKVVSVSDKEISLQASYNQRISTCNALFLLPAGEDKLRRLYDNFHQTDEFKTIKNKSSSGLKSYYILHPAKRGSQDFKGRIQKLECIQQLKADDLCASLATSDPVTEVVATLFNFVVHYGSSVSLVLGQYGNTTQEIKLEEFK